MIFEHALGALPDSVDSRDHEYERPGRIRLPVRVDLRKHCPPVYDQMGLNSCTAQAVAAGLHFDLLKETKRPFAPSRMFIYYNTRALEGTERSNAPTTLRDSYKVAAARGFCPESLWAYKVEFLMTRPRREAYRRAVKHKLLRYLRLGRDRDHLRTCLAEGFPFTLGIAAYMGLLGKQAAQDGRVPMPRRRERKLGYHALLTIGYDDRKQAFRLRNSFGPVWGDSGDCWLPYEYLESAARVYDCWTMRVVR